MEMRKLRYFLAVADRENFTRAAESVHVSQPSLSVQIQALEEEVGTPLFHRLGRRAVLTEAGHILRQHAVRVLGELDQAQEAIREVTGGERGQLLVGAFSTVNTYLIPPVVSRFRKQFPNIQLQVEAQPSLAIEQGLVDNRLDLGLCLLPVANRNIRAAKLFDETLCLVGPRKDSRVTQQARMRMRDLAALPLVLMPVDYCLRKIVEAECRQVGIQANVSVEMSSPEGILEAVAQGAGWTILPELYVQHRLRQKSLRVVNLYDPVPRHAVGVAHIANRHLGKAAQAFVHLCREMLAVQDVPERGARSRGRGERYRH